MKDQSNKIKKQRVVAQKLISIDQPFDYEEVAAITGSEYVLNLNRDDSAIPPYEELKKNAPGFHLLEDRCIWMKAGIISFRLCDYDNDCYSCPFDQAIRSAMGAKAPPEKKERQVDWVIQLKEKYQIAQRPCIHFKSGLIDSPKECTGNYECYHCRIHQMLYTKKHAESIVKPKYSNVSGYRLADGYYYHFGHAWVHIEHDGWVRIGIDDFISKVIGPADMLDLPSVGGFLKQGEVGWVLTRNGRKAPMQSPVSGIVFAVNDKVRKQPAIVQNNPYEDGWLFLLDPASLKLNLKGLYFGKECFQWIEKENKKLLELLGPQYEQLAATGGQPLADIYGHISEMPWDRLVFTFLQTAEKS